MILNLFLIALSCLGLNEALENSRYYPRYHLAPPKGWMNDPNGFSVFKGEYHLFYQYNPESSLEPGIANWGHAKSKDLFHWIDLGIALENDTAYDKNGVFSGSAVIDSDVMYLFYTGHVNLPGQSPNQSETQALAISSDGVHFKKYENNPIIVGKDLQPNIRDPKVWKHGEDWYMVIGNSFINHDGEQRGRVLLFKSADKINWSQVSILQESDGYLGYMSECPDFFELDGLFVLLFSPQGVKPDGDNYKNLYQTGYIIGHFSYETYKFTPITKFRELDSGHDVYATQTILDDYGRRLYVAWMDMWETQYPEAIDGYTGQQTLIRSLHLSKDYRLIQKPVEEVVTVRDKKLFSGNYIKGTKVSLSNRTGEVLITAFGVKDLVLYIGNDTSSVEIKYEWLTGYVSLKRDNTDDGLRRTKYGPVITLKMRVFIDASSIEVFLGEGEVTFTSRFFLDGNLHVRLGNYIIVGSMEVYDMKTTLYNS